MTLSCNIDSLARQHIPHKVAHVGKEVIRNFPHTKRVGNYLLGRTLGEGSFAKVKESLHTPTGEKVAIKVIDKKKARVDIYVRRNLRREAKLLQLLRHDHVVQLYEVMETKNSYYLVTELCQGGDLMDRINSNRRLDETETKRLIRQIISAVDHIHKAGILHRDLKIENLLLDENKNIKIIDFGLSNYLQGSPVTADARMRDMCSTQCGSPAYAAPELLANTKYGAPVDVWSIGINMYAMLSGHLPFTVEPFSIKALHEKMLKGDMNTPPDHVSNECLDFLRRLLVANPDRRMSLTQAMQHVWLTSDNHTALSSDKPTTNCQQAEDSSKLCDVILKHMTHHLGYQMNEAVAMVTGNMPHDATATYHLLVKRLRRYNELVETSGASKDTYRANRPSVTTLSGDLLQSRKMKPNRFSVRRKSTVNKLTTSVNCSTAKVIPLAKRKFVSAVKAGSYVTEHQRPMKTAETTAETSNHQSSVTTLFKHATVQQVAPRADNVMIFRLAAPSPTKNYCFEDFTERADSVRAHDHPSSNSYTTHAVANVISPPSNTTHDQRTCTTNAVSESPKLPTAIEPPNASNVTPRIAEHRGAPYKLSSPTYVHKDVKQCFSTTPNHCRFPLHVTRGSVVRSNGANKCVPEYAHYEKFARRCSNMFPAMSKCDDNVNSTVHPTDSKTSPETQYRRLKTGVSRSLSFRDKHKHNIQRRIKLPRRQSVEISTYPQSNKTETELDNEQLRKIDLTESPRPHMLPSIAAVPSTAAVPY